MEKARKNIQNFGLIKEVFNTLLVDAVSSKDNSKKKLFKNYVKTVKENEILKTQFLVYTNIENKIESDESKALQFVKENIDLFSAFKKDDILEANLNLSKSILFEQAIETKNTELYENISKLIFINKTPNSIDEIVNATDLIVKHILNNKPKEITESLNSHELPISFVSTLMVDKYNEKYSGLDESERKILKIVIESTDEEKKTVYSNTIRECIDLINEKLVESDLDTKDKLLRVKDKLLNDTQDINEEFIGKISKLIELRTSLKGE